MVAETIVRHEKLIPPNAATAVASVLGHSDRGAGQGRNVLRPYTGPIQDAAFRSGASPFIWIP